MKLEKTEDLTISQVENLAKDNSAQIMIVDDSPEILNLLQDILVYHDYRVLPFTSGEAALKSLTDKIPDLVLLDVSIPDIGGYEICKRLKSTEKTAKVPVIFISGHYDIEDKVKGFKAGGVDYIAKPFELKEIIARVETHLSLRRLQNRLEKQNIQLHQEIAERKKVENELREHKTHLEELVAVRTAELSKTNDELSKEIIERKHLETALEISNYKLHSLVYEYGLRHQRMSIFKQMAEQLQACLSVEDTYPLISNFVQKLFHASKGVVFLFDQQEKIFTAVTSWNKTLRGQKKFSAEDCLSLHEGTIHVSVDSAPESCCRHLECAEGKSNICIPLQASGKTMGILHLQQRSSAKSLPTRHLFESTSEVVNADTKQLALAMADFFALALVNIQLRDSLKQQAIRDPLTGLFNRRYMEETLNREISRAKRQRTPMGIIMLDLDHFRRFNNTFGHEAGDLVLQELAKILQSHIRIDDIACRYGGEEFVLIMPGASLEITQKRAESLLSSVQDLQLQYKGNPLDTITLSLGVAVYPGHGQTGGAVLKAADKALYRAKRSGRKQVKVAKITTRAPGK